MILDTEGVETVGEGYPGTETDIRCILYALNVYTVFCMTFAYSMYVHRN